MHGTTLTLHWDANIQKQTFRNNIKNMFSKIFKGLYSETNIRENLELYTIQNAQYIKIISEIFRKYTINLFSNIYLDTYALIQLTYYFNSITSAII